jgi:hypothetical protein
MKWGRFANCFTLLLYYNMQEISISNADREISLDLILTKAEGI